MPERATPVLDVRGLKTVFRTRAGDVHAVNDVSFSVAPGELLGVVGESGSGKSVTMMSLIGLLPSPPAEIRAGQVLFGGKDLLKVSDQELRDVRGAKVGIIFQDPMTSLDPCFKVGAQIVEAILAHEDLSRSQARTRAIELLDQVKIADAARRFHAYPHELSGGLRQRVMIAAALALRPEILIADEPTTALDVTTQAAIVALVDELRRDLDLGVLWITHDLGVVAQLADRVAVLYAGEMVECASRADIFSKPRHPYTVGLIDSARVRDPGLEFGLIAGSVPEPGFWPDGCRFSPRCPIVAQACQVHPHLEADEDHLVRCHFPGKAGLR